ncbi:hypothetical protein SEUCBS140593_001793 [Sporothrix eucalyptigena]|uniref:Uncharacterized protein n=1 Tax=Sporothrix eucalyptigena TaxID=1812306 RepID=A0ABP0B144_9PEZI
MSSAEELGRNQTRTSKIGKGRENQAATHSPTTIAYTTLTSMTNYLHMASTYVKHFHFMDQFYEKVINDYGAHVEKHGGPAVGKTSVRQGGNGGGLDEWKLHGLKVINNGTLLSAEDQLADTSDLEKESSRSDKDNDAAESCLTPVDDHSRKPRWIAPAGSKPNSAAAKVAGTSPKGDQQHNGSVAQDVAMKDQGDGISAGTSVAPEGDIQGVVFGNESDSRSLGGTVGDSANGGNLESVQGHQQWAQYTEPPDPVHQVPHLNSQGLGTSDAMLLTQVGSLDPALQGAYLVNGPATDARMSYNAAEIFEFLALNESNRWEGELQAASIGHFAQGDFEGGSLWNVVPYPVGFPEYQE